MFKIWAAQQAVNKIPLIIGQHGGSYGIARWNFGEDHQLKIADRFVSWGWNNKNSKKIFPIGILKNIGKKIKWDLEGNALLVVTTVPRYSYHMYSVPVSSSQWQKYFENVILFLKILPASIRLKVVVKLYPEDYENFQLERLKDSVPDLNLCSTNESIDKLLKKIRTVILL